MALRYPPATWKGDGESGGEFIDAPYRVVLHTTETAGVPGYDGGATAPHLTYEPKAGRWTQHTDMAVAARALRNEPGGVNTNRASSIQVELVCYSARSIAENHPSRLWVGDLPDSAYGDLREFLDWCASTFEVAMKWPEKQAYNSAQANEPGFRMGNGEWIEFDGVCGHQHVPENTHWDPGALEWDKLFEEDEMALTEEEQNMVRDHLAALKAAGGGTRVSRANLLNKGSLIAKNYPTTPAAGGGGVSEEEVKQMIASTHLDPA